MKLAIRSDGCSLKIQVQWLKWLSHMQFLLMGTGMGFVPLRFSLTRLITDWSLLGLSDTPPNYYMCGCQSSVVMVSLSFQLPRQSFLWKPYWIIGKFRSEGSADHFVQPLVESRVSSEDTPLLVKGWVGWALTLNPMLEKGQWILFNSWHEGQPFIEQRRWHLPFHLQSCDKWWCQSGSTFVLSKRPFQPLNKPPI